MSDDPEPVQLPAEPQKPKPPKLTLPPGEPRIEVAHLLARVDDVLSAFARFAPFSEREVYEIRLRSARVSEILGEE